MNENINLNGKLLIAMPGIGDRNFDKSVIYICSHSEGGTMGLIVNKPSADLKLSDLFEQLSIIPNRSVPSETIYIGDHSKDLEAGISAGTKTIGCRYGYSLTDCNFFDGADLVDSAQEIISLIQ